MLDKPIVVNKSDFNNDVITKWVATNPEYLLLIVLIGNKLCSDPMVIVN